MHAEMDALRFYKPGDSIEVIRFRPDGSYGMAKPCKYCRIMMKDKGVRTVRYTNELGEFKTLRIGE